MSMGWLMSGVVFVMLSGLIATIMVGQSKSNRQEDPTYYKNTGKKWLRLGWIYIIGMAIVVILLAIFVNE
jgi:Na+-transporting methylmalonyl-CoA/oxaloacetate decarboxylase gamma subunit